MAKGQPSGGFFGFIDILHGLPVVPKIIMFVGLMALISGFFPGTFSLCQNPKVRIGAGLIFASLGWRDWERVSSRISGPHQKPRPNWVPLVKGLLFMGMAAVLFWYCHLASSLLRL